MYNEDGCEVHPNGWAMLLREKVTLGLGDVLGVRSIYPCDCPLPRIYVP